MKATKPFPIHWGAVFVISTVSNNIFFMDFGQFSCFVLYHITELAFLIVSSSLFEL